MKLTPFAPRTPRGTRLLPGLALLAGFTLLAPPLPARVADDADPPSAAASARPDNTYAQLARIDRDFIVDATHANAKGMVIARVASTRATHPEVRAFAESLVAADDDRGSGLARLAATKNVTLGPAVSAKVGEPWTNQPASGFDRDFLHEVTSSLERDRNLYQTVLNDGKDSDASDFAREGLSALVNQLQAAESLQKLLRTE